MLLPGLRITLIALMFDISHAIIKYVSTVTSVILGREMRQLKKKLYYEQPVTTVFKYSCLIFLIFIKALWFPKLFMAEFQACNVQSSVLPPVKLLLSNVLFPSHLTSLSPLPRMWDILLSLDSGMLYQSFVTPNWQSLNPCDRSTLKKMCWVPKSCTPQLIWKYTIEVVSVKYCFSAFWLRSSEVVSVLMFTQPILIRWYEIMREGSYQRWRKRLNYTALSMKYQGIQPPRGWEGSKFQKENCTTAILFTDS